MSYPSARDIPAKRSFRGGNLFRMCRLLGSFLVFFILLFQSTCLSASEQISDDGTKQIVVLYSGPLDFPATEQTEKAIREVFFANTAFHTQIFSEYLNLSRFRDPGQRRAHADLLRQRYRHGGIDVVISVDVPAVLFLLEHGESIFPGLPVVVCSIPESLSERIDASPLGGRTTRVFEPSNSRDIVLTALSLRPGTNSVVLISGAYENDRVRSVGLRRAIESLSEKRIQLIDLSGLPLGELIRRSRDLPRDSVIFFATFFVDGAGRSFVPRDVVRMIADTASVPVFGLYETYLGYGIVGGKLVSLAQQGKRAAEAAVAILRGKASQPAGVKEGNDSYVVAYDWKQLKRWGINEADLPAGGKVINREATAWDLYKSYILGGISLIVLESMLILALVINLQRRKRAEVALLNSRQDLKLLAGRLISSQEEELSRLSREFHDDIAQRLAAAAIESGTLEIQSRNLEPFVLGKIGRIKEQLIGLSEDVHAISRQIHPSILKDLGLVRAIDSQCVRFSDRENIPASFHAHDIPESIPKEAALCLYRIVQESLRNIAKHSGARNVEVSLRHENGNILLKVGDDGVGFAPQCARLTTRDRAREHEGKGPVRERRFQHPVGTG